MIKNLKDLKKTILTSKRDDVDLSKALASILKQVEAATIGVKNPETNEEKLILGAAKKELKEQEQSKNLGAPYSERTLELCKDIIQLLSPQMVSEEQTRIDIQNVINFVSLCDDPDMKTLMQFAKHSGKNYDMSLVSKISMELLKQI
jgi:hypothetical protein